MNLEARQRVVRDLATVLRLCAEDLDRLADDLPGMDGDEAARRVAECMDLTRAAIRGAQS